MAVWWSVLLQQEGGGAVYRFDSEGVLQQTLSNAEW
jgi:hypothetical protein